MGKAESKTPLAKNDSDLQLSIKKRFNQLSNGRSVIDKPSFFIKEERFVQFGGMMLGDLVQQAEALQQLQQPIEQVLNALVSSFMKCEGMNTSTSLLLVDFLMDDIPSQLDTYSLSQFMQRKMILLIIIKQISELLFLEQNNHKKLLPEAGKRSLLTPAAFCLLYANLPEDLRSQWKLLFSSEKDGESFAKLLQSVGGAGPCLIIIETSSGCVFGAFASQGFICGPSYTGDNRCFLFKDRKKLQIFNATGYNTNFGYLNSHQLTMPNGIGMGGREENWCFFLHENFESGTSTPSISTFEQCWLADETTFKPKKVEVWQIGERRVEIAEDAELQDEFAQQRLSTNKRETRAILEMSGKEFRGDIYRKQKE